jgi:hypothetical protein
MARTAVGFVLGVEGMLIRSMRQTCYKCVIEAEIEAAAQNLEIVGSSCSRYSRDWGGEHAKTEQTPTMTS